MPETLTASTCREFLMALVACTLAAAALFLTAPAHGEFWWSDAPRHALNGVFLADMLRAMPLHHASDWAMQYYVKYPALTILFYPPLFYVICVPFYLLFGVSHAVALTVVLLHDTALGAGMYALSRRWLRVEIAIATGLAIMLAPVMAFWGRQVMLDIPALAFGVWAMVVLRRHGETGRPGPLYLGVFLVLCAVYTKLNLAFLTIPAAIAIICARGVRAVARDRHAWIAAALFVLGMLPVVWLTLHFGKTNVQSAAGIADSRMARTSLANWLFYATRLPAQLGWPLFGCALLAPVVASIRRTVAPFTRSDVAMLIAWFVVGYLMFSAIDLKSPRFTTPILPPVLIAAGLTVQWLLPARAASAGFAAALVAATAAITFATDPVPRVSGYREAADWIARAAPPDAVVLFSGERDGSFVFNMRAERTRQDIYTVRADKILLKVAVRRTLGVKQEALTTDQIAERLDKLGVSYVVAQSNFWTDLTEMARLQDVLHSDQFEAVARIPVASNYPVNDKEIVIYRNRHPVAAGGTQLNVSLPIIGRDVQGQLPAKP
jgi:4-amino-4-deoxy-L-arabinose transferase-like glycosyltransferase